MTKVPFAAREHLHKEIQHGYVSQGNERTIDVLVSRAPSHGWSVSGRLSPPRSSVGARIFVDLGVLGGAKTSTTEPTAPTDEPLPAQEPVQAPPAALEEEEREKCEQNEQNDGVDEDLLWRKNSVFEDRLDVHQ